MIKGLEKLLAAILLIACAIAAPAAAQFEPNVSPTQEILEGTPVAVMEEDGFFAVDPVTKRVIDNVSPVTIMPGGSGNTGSETNTIGQEYAASDKGSPDLNPADNTPEATGSSSDSATLEESLVATSGSTLPKEEDADHYKNAAELPGLLKLTVTPTDVTISTEEYALVVIPAGTELVHSLGATTLIKSFDTPVYLAKSLDPIKIELAGPLGFGNVDLRTVTINEYGHKTYHTIASTSVRGSMHTSL